MADNRLHTVLDQLRRLHCVADATQRTDRELLRAFVANHDQDAFASVVTRHASLVWGVCRRILGHHQDAEDAFQATFLILARGAASAQWQSSVGGWLHTVAQRLAVRTLKRSEQRRALEHEASRTTREEQSLRELAAVVDEELRWLPAKYRAPLLLHYLEGATAEAAARQLGLSRGTFYNRLAYGRELLRERLSRQGLSLAAPLLAAALSAEAEAASRSLIEATVRGVMETVPERVAALAAEALSAPAIVKLKIGLALGLLLGVAAAGVALLTPRAPVAPIPQVERPAAPPKADDKAAARVDLHGDPLPEGAIARLGTLRFRMESAENKFELVFSPDGKMIAVASIGGLWLFDAATGKRTKWIRPPYTSFWQVAFSPDGKRLTAAAQQLNPAPQKDGVQIWDVAAGRKTTEVELKGMLRLGWTAEGQPLVAYWEKEAIILREIATGRERRFSAKDLSTSFTSNYAVGKKVVTATSNETGVIHVWDMKSGKERWAFETGGSFVSYLSLVLSPDERWIASLTTNTPNKYTVQLWDLTTGKSKPIVTLDQAHLESTAFTRDGKTLATIGQQEIRFWDTASGERGRLKREGQGFNVSAVGFAPDSKTFATMENTCGAILLWDVATGKPNPKPEGHSTNWVQAASFSPDGKRVATSGGMDGTIRVWDAASGRQLVQFHRSYPNYAAGCAFSTDGRTLCSSWNDQLLLSDAATGRELQTLKCANRKMYLSSDLRKAIALQSPRGGIGGKGGPYGGPPGGMGTKSAWEMIGWDIATGKRFFHRPLTNPISERNLTLSPDAKVLAVPNVEREPMHLEDVETGDRLLTFPVLKGNTKSLAFSPDGRLLISETTTPAPRDAPDNVKRTLHLWEVLTANEVLALPVYRYLLGTAAFSPDGRLLATLAPEGEILVWDLRTRKELHRFKGFDSSVTLLAFSPDSRRLVSGLVNSTLLVWDVPPPGSSPAAKRAVEDAAKAWADLAGSDAPRAFRARWTLASAPEEAMQALTKHLHPAQAADPQRVRRLLANLESEQLAVREKAQEELANLGDLAEPVLRQTLANKPTLEVRRRVQAVLERLRGPVTRPELLRSLRAVAVLEDIGTRGARRLLEKLVTGAPEARLTREAKESLKRLDLRNSSGR